jgi:hypothetical protein
MTPEEQRHMFEKFRRSKRERAEQRRAEWDAGRVHLGGVGDFAGIGDPILRESYLTAARELLDKNRGHLLQVALPILFLQRHALELALKHAVRVLVGFHEITEEPESLGRHHLKRLLRDFKRLLGPDDGEGETLTFMESLIARFHKLDRTRKWGPGEWVRYRDDALPAPLDLGELQCDLDDLFKRLFARPRDVDAPFGWITGYEDEMHARGVQEYLDGEEAA